MGATDAGRAGFLLVALGFPLYLLWKGRLPLYLSLATTAPVASPSANTVAPGSTMGGSASGALAAPANPPTTAGA